MHYRHLLILSLTAALCLACAAAPAPRRIRNDARLSLRHLNKGASYYNKGCYAKALAHLREAHERFTAADDLPGTAESLNSIANTYYRLGDFQKALVLYDEAIMLFRQLGQTSGQVRALANKAAVLIADGQPDMASTALDQAEKAAGGRPILLALRMKTRAMLLLARNMPGEAQTVLMGALSAAANTDLSVRADIQYTLGHLMLTTENPETALSHLEAALEIDRGNGAYFSVAMDLAALGTGCDQLSRYDDAAGYYRRSIKIFALLQAPHKVRWVLPRFISSADKAGVDIGATIQWTEDWLAGRQESDICR